MPVINTNVNALAAQQTARTNSRAMSASMEHLSTGSRVNSAKDDAAGLAIGQNMSAQVRGINMAIRNVNDGVNLLQTADGAIAEQANMLQRMRELSVQSSSGTYSSTQRGYLNTEFAALSSQIDKIGSETTWNGYTLLTGGTFSFQTGQSSGQTIDVAIGSMTVSGLAISATTGGVGIATSVTAATTITALDTAIGTLNSQRATLGAKINQLTYAGDNLSNISGNIQASRSTIMDTDYATASTQLSKTQIIQQAATAMLAQANQQPQSVLSLLK